MTLSNNTEAIEIDKYLFKEEPDFSNFGEFIGVESGMVTLSKLLEDTLTLTSHQRLANGHTGKVVLFKKMIGTFHENMEMRKFPFDRQLLRFKITAAVPQSMLYLKVADETFEGQKGWCNAKLRMSEYTVGVNDQDQPEDEERKHKTMVGTSKENSDGKIYDQLVVTVYLTRRPDKYMVNIVLLLFLLVATSCSGFVVPLKEVGDREGSMVTFLLTIMALKYVVNDQLPDKPYQTFIDWYILFSFILLCVPALEFTALEFWEPPQGDTFVDRAWTFTLLVVWSILHLMILVCFLYPSTTIWDDWETVKSKQEGKGEDSSKGVSSDPSSSQNFPPMSSQDATDVNSLPSQEAGSGCCNTCCSLFCAWVVPPVGIYWRFGCGWEFVVCLVLTLLGYIPGIIFACVLIALKPTGNADGEQNILGQATGVATGLMEGGYQLAGNMADSLHDEGSRTGPTLLQGMRSMRQSVEEGAGKMATNARDAVEHIQGAVQEA
eukprot:TRINITY_DN6358_c0_g1_i3.p1 TRINITY_DN6358_c0_g1~~TRINITY_DN6358_c0_g1_i3.p1  ORF type:complete len:492 (-),score=83.16 TRINITY_DN6358_c0_g1_i3:255-1730(-)